MIRPTRPARLASMLTMTCLFMAAVPAAADIDLEREGWHRWQVQAGASGRNACCYRFRENRSTVAMGCRLGDVGKVDGGDLDSADDCSITSDSMHVYVEMKDGRVREIMALSSNCPVSVAGELRTLEDVSAPESIAWLKQLAVEQPGLAEEAIMTVSFHAEGEALSALVGLIEDTSQHRDAREHAMFWLVQTESDEAFAYLDRLLE